MKIKSILLFFTYFLTLSKPVKAYIYRFDKYDNLFCFGDIHLGSNPETKHPTLNNKKLTCINKKQAFEIIEFVKKLGPNSLVLVENIYDCNKDAESKEFYESVKESNLKDNFSCSLLFIYDYCKANKIEVLNVEHRHKKYEFVCYPDRVTSQEFLNDFQQVINEIRTYDDGILLNNYYQQTINELIQNNSKAIDLLKKNKNKFFHQFRKKLTLKDLERFDIDYSKLLNLRILHIINQNKNKDKNIFICVGGAHIDDIDEILQKIGFQKNLNKIYYDKKHREKPLNINWICNQILERKIQIFKINSLYLIFLLIILSFSFFINLYTKSKKLRQTSIA